MGQVAKRGRKGEGGVWQMLFSAIPTCHSSERLRSFYCGQNQHTDDITTCPHSPNFHSTLLFYLCFCDQFKDALNTVHGPGSYCDHAHFLSVRGFSELHTHAERQKVRWVIGRVGLSFYGVYIVTLVVKINHCCCVQARFVGKDINLLLPCYNMDIYSALINLCIISFGLIFAKNLEKLSITLSFSKAR
jgi:hypothetical protein